MALVELQYLFEMERLVVKPQEILVKLNVEVGWVIVAHAKANGVSPLLDTR
jgi:hypothetical protein